MASTYSTSLKLELMATGDQSGTWGDTTNTNLGTLLEQAVTGVLSVAQGDATLTLTSLNGASDQARNAVINLTGAMTAGRDVIVPTANKVYLIKNSTTGGFVVTVKTVAGTGVTIPNGTARWVYCDGTNVVDALSGPWTPSANDGQALGASGTAWADLFLASGAVINWNAGDVTLTHAANTLAFAGASSGYTFDAAVTPSANDAAALGSATVSWADLFLASGAVVNVANGNWAMTHTSGIMTVGTGDLRVTTAGTNSASVATVGGTQTLTAKTLTSPVITTSPTAAGATWTDLGSVTTVDINGGTADGVVIGGASAAAGTFTTATANAFVPNNSAVPTNGVYLPAANTLGWAINSAAEMQLTATALSPAANDGNALGTTTLMWADLFLASGGVINWNNGDVTITHASDTLTFASADTGYVLTNATGIVRAGANSVPLAITGTASAAYGSLNVGAASANKVYMSFSEVGVADRGALGFDAGSTTLKLRNGSASGTVWNQWTSTDYSPGVSDGSALGTTSLMWSDLFLASGGVINWNNGDVTITHSADTITLAGGNLALASTALINTSATGPTIIQGGGQFGNVGFLRSSQATALGYGVKPDPAINNSYVSSVAGAAARSAIEIGAGTFTVRTATSSTIAVDSAASLTSAFDIDVNGVVNLPIGQLKFPATQNASSNANTLDDYEEGTWTPTFSSTGATFSYAAQVGRYTKTGNQVTAMFRIALNNSGNTLTANPLTITGLPFAIITAAGLEVTFDIGWFQSTTSYVKMTGYVLSAGTSIAVLGLTASAVSISALNSNAALHATNQSSMYGMISYTTAT